MDNLKRKKHKYIGYRCGHVYNIYSSDRGIIKELLCKAGECDKSQRQKRYLEWLFQETTAKKHQHFNFPLRVLKQEQREWKKRDKYTSKR